MEAGYKYKLKVVRKTDLGYMLSDGTDEVLMFFQDMNADVTIGSEIEAFIFYDKKSRMCATTKDVAVTMEQPGFVKVVEIVENLGVFVSINTSKDVLVPLDYLPHDKKRWPHVDDMLLISLKNKRGSLSGKILNRFEIADLGSKTKYEENAMIRAFVARVGDEGVNLVTEDLVHVFVHHTMLRKNYRVGQDVVVKIVHEGRNGYNGSLIENKEKMIDPDKELILNYLEKSNGKMKLDSKSSSEEIEGALHISRKAFKRALGGLYKEHRVEFKDGYTILIK